MRAALCLVLSSVLMDCTFTTEWRWAWVDAHGTGGLAVGFLFVG